MHPQKTMVCQCDNCGSEAEMTIKCEVVLPPDKGGIPPQVEKIKRPVVCSRCGNEADMIVDYAHG